VRGLYRPRLPGFGGARVDHLGKLAKLRALPGSCARDPAREAAISPRIRSKASPGTLPLVGSEFVCVARDAAGKCAQVADRAGGGRVRGRSGVASAFQILAHVAAYDSGSSGACVDGEEGSGGGTSPGSFRSPLTSLASRAQWAASVRNSAFALESVAKPACKRHSSDLRRYSSTLLIWPPRPMYFAYTALRAIRLPQSRYVRIFNSATVRLKFGH